MVLDDKLDELNKSLEKLKKIYEETVEQPKEKKFKYPFGKKVGKKQKKKNYITLLKLNENRYAEWKKVQIENQSFIENDVPRLALAGYVFTERKNPLIILPSWRVKPISPPEKEGEPKVILPFSAVEDQEESMKDGSNINGYAVLLAAMEEAKTNMKKSLGGMGKFIGIGLGVVLLGVIIYAVISGGHP